MDPPSPDSLPAEAEQARARQAMQAAVDKYLAYWGPRYATTPIDVDVEGEWAHSVAAWEGEAAPPGGPLHVLARRLPDGEWQALLPGSDELFSQWVEEVPERLVPEDQKSQLRNLVLAADALQKPQRIPQPQSTAVHQLSTLERGNRPSEENGKPTKWIDPEFAECGVASHEGDTERPRLSSSDEEAAQKAIEALPRVQKEDDQTGNHFEVFDVWGTPDWAVGELALVDEQGVPVPSSGDVVIAWKALNGQWFAVDKGTADFNTRLQMIPDEYLAPSTKQMLYVPVGVVTVQEESAGIYKLPTACNTNAHVVGVHSDPGQTYDIDFTIGGDVVAARDGHIEQIVEHHNECCYSSVCAPCNNYVVIDHEDGEYSYYLHIKQGSVPDHLSVGSVVHQGDKIAEQSDVGWSGGNGRDDVPCNGKTYDHNCGVHLHFGVHKGPYWNSTTVQPRFQDVYDSTESWFVSGGQTYQSGNCGGSNDTTRPDGDITSPSEDATVSSRTVRLAGWASDSQSGLHHAHFTAYYNGNWRQVGPDFTSSPFGFDWDMCDAGVLNGSVTIGLDIWDNAGNIANSPRGVRHFTKNFDCSSPSPGGKWNAKYYNGHDCYNDTSMSCADGHVDHREEISYPGGSRLIDKKWTGAPAGGMQADNWSGLFETTVNFPSDEYVFYAIYDDAIRLEIGGYGMKGPWEYNGYNKVTICNGSQGWNLSGNVPLKIYLREDGGDAYAMLEYGTDTSVCVSAPDPPGPAEPPNGAMIGEGQSITLCWSDTGDEYYGEIWGGPGGTLTFGWQSGTCKNIGSQWAGYNYSWHVKARNSAGESGWSSTRTFTVQPAAPSNLDAQAIGCDQINLTWTNNSGSYDGFKVYRNGAYLTSTSNTSYHDTGLNENTTYSYYVKAYKGSIESAASNTDSAGTPPCAVPQPDLIPAKWTNWQYPIVPSSFEDTDVVSTLYAGYVTYIDWGLANRGEVSSGGNSYADLYIDGDRVHHYDFGDVQPGAHWAFLDWQEIIDTPGWHTLRVVVDPDDLVEESNENNNAWEGTFYWTPVAPYSDHVESGANDWTATGLWHQVDDYASPYGESHSASHSWWYGQDATGDYDTGSANSGDLTSPPIYVPTGGYYLRFWYRYETETQWRDWDQRWVQISMDEGPFENVAQLYDDPQNYWLQSRAVDLSGLEGHTVRVRFHFETIDDSFNGYRGWYIDDFEISSTPPPGCANAYEPNDTPGQAKSIAYGQTVSAEICPNGDYDYYKFNGAAGDRVVVDVDAAANGSLLDTYVFLLDSDQETVLAANDDEILVEIQDSHLGYELAHDGTYYIKLRAWDHPSAGGPDHYYTLKLLKDQAGPSSVTITSPGSNAWLNPSQETIFVSAADPGSGIRVVSFWWHDADWDNPDWEWLGEDWDGRDGWSMGFDTGSQPEHWNSAFYVYAYDWAGNSTGAGAWNLGIDRTPPSVSVSISQMYGDAPFLDFWVNWWDSYDNLSGVASYDVQFRDGASGAWQSLAANTTDTQTRFVGQNGHTYYFRARARDYAGNLGVYTGGDGDVQHTVQVCPVSADGHETDNSYGAARAIGTKGVEQTRNFHAAGDQDWLKFTATAGVTYTLATTNTGGHADTMLSLYDTNGTTRLAFNDDDAERWPASQLKWGAMRGGTYYVKVEHWDPHAYGCTTVYTISIAETGRFDPSTKTFLPLILK
jgi:hypothetical protein